MSAEVRLTELLAKWEALHARGQPVPPEELCQDCPELLEPLRQQIAIRQRLDAGWGTSDTLPVRQATPVVFSSAAIDPDATRDAAPSVPATTDPSSAGSTLRWPEVPGYEILSELGQGGMGVVFKARQKSLGRLVALKMIRSGSLAGSVELARFRAEVESVAQLQHPNIVQVYEVGEFEGRPFFAMEFVNGCDLRFRLEDRPQPVRVAAQLAETLAHTMHVVHQRGIIHRDLKPANVMLQADASQHGGLGIPKITDFGLAKRMDAADGPTLSGNIVGTPSYMAPEQAAGKSKLVGPATDVYALGTILYEMLTGRSPFEAESAWDTILLVTSADPVPPRHFQPKVPLDLETICLKCLEKEPGKRYASAEALAEDLRRFLAGEPILARPIGWSGRAVKWAKRRPAVAALLAVILAAFVALFLGGVVHQIEIRTALAQAQANAEESRRRLVRLYVTQGRNLLEDGDWLGALVWFVEALEMDHGDPAGQDMHRRRIATLLRECPPLVRVWFHDQPVWHVQFSPDCRQVLTVSEDSTACIWDAKTGEQVARFAEHNAPVWHGTFDPTGQRVATASTDGIACVWEARTGRRLLPPLRHKAAVNGVFFSPNGRQILTASDDGRACLWDAATGRASGELPHKGKVKWATFSPDGMRVATACEDGTAAVWEASTGRMLPPRLEHDGAVTDVQFHPDGRWLATASADGKARLWDAVTGKLLPRTMRQRAKVIQVVFSRDGRHLITCSDDQTACIWETTTGELATPRLRHASGINYADFSPDGRRVVTGGDDNTARVWDTETGEPLTPLLKSHGSINAVVFSPCGSWVVTAATDATARLWSVKDVQPAVAGSRAEYPDPYAAHPHPSWHSPDQRWVVESHRDHTAQVLEAATGERIGPPLKHGSCVVYGAFSRDGRLLVTTSDDNLARIWEVREGQLLTQPLRHKGTVRYAEFSEDGRLVLTASADRTVRVWDAQSGEPISPPWRFPAPVKQTVFAADGGAVTVTGLDGTEKTWDLRPEERAIADLRNEVQALAGSWLDVNRGLLPLGPEQLSQVLERRKRD